MHWNSTTVSATPFLLTECHQPCDLQAAGRCFGVHEGVLNSSEDHQAKLVRHTTRVTLLSQRQVSHLALSYMTHSPRPEAVYQGVQGARHCSCQAGNLLCDRVCCVTVCDCLACS